MLRFCHTEGTISQSFQNPINPINPSSDNCPSCESSNPVNPASDNYSKVYNYLDTVGRGYKPRQRGWGGAATLQNVNLFLDFTITPHITDLNSESSSNRTGF